MKNIQNIIGGERNFLFSDKKDFCNLQHFLEQKWIFEFWDIENMDNLKSSQKKENEEITKIKSELENLKKELSETTNSEDKDKTKNIQKNINEKKNILIDKKELFQDTNLRLDSLNNTLPIHVRIEDKIAKIYRKFSKIRPDSDNLNDFKLYLEQNWIWKIQENWDIILKWTSDLDGESWDIWKLSRLLGIFDWETSTHNEYIISNEKLKDVMIAWKESEIVKDFDKVKNSATNWIWEMIKWFWLSNFAESEWWIITWLAAITGLIKFAPAWLRNTVLWWILWYVTLNVWTWWKAASFLSKFLWINIDKVQLEDSQKKFLERYQFSLEEWKTFTKIKKEDISDKYLDKKWKWKWIKDLQKAAKWENESDDLFKNKPVWISNKMYAIVLLKTFAREWWHVFTEDEGVENIPLETLKNWQKYFSEQLDWLSGDMLIYKYTTATAIETYAWNLEWAKQHIDNISKSVYKQMEKSWINRQIEELWTDIEDVWWASVIFKYTEDWKYKIFSSKENVADDNPVAEIWKWSWRMIIWSVWASVSSITWMFWWWDYLKDWISAAKAIQNIKNIEKTWITTNKDELKKMLPFIWEQIKDKNIWKNEIKLIITNDKWEFKYWDKTFKKKPWWWFEFS